MNSRNLTMLQKSVIAVLAIFLALAASARLTVITVIMRNDTAFQNTYEVTDIANGSITVVTIPPHKTSAIRLRSSGTLDDGYGDLYWRYKGNQGWNHAGLLRHGESVSL